MLESDIVVQSGVSGCLALTRLPVFLLLGRRWGRRGQLLWRRFLPCSASAGGVLSRPLCLMLIWLAASVLAATSFHLAGYNRAAAILWVGVSVFTFTIPASGLLAAKWLLSCCQCPYHNFLWLL